MAYTENDFEQSHKNEFRSVKLKSDVKLEKDQEIIDYYLYSLDLNETAQRYRVTIGQVQNILQDFGLL